MEKGRRRGFLFHPQIYLFPKRSQKHSGRIIRILFQIETLQMSYKPNRSPHMSGRASGGWCPCGREGGSSECDPVRKEIEPNQWRILMISCPKHQEKLSLSLSFLQFLVRHAMTSTSGYGLWRTPVFSNQLVSLVAHLGFTAKACQRSPHG